MTGKPVAVVTGGAGFIGSHMVDAALSAGYSVRVIDNLTGGHRANLDETTAPRRNIGVMFTETQHRRRRVATMRQIG